MAEYLGNTAEYKALAAHAEKTKEFSMRELFEQDPKRFEEFRYIHELAASLF